MHSVRTDTTFVVIMKITNILEQQAFLQSNAASSLVSYARSALSGISSREGGGILHSIYGSIKIFFFEQVIIPWKLGLIKSNTVPVNAFSYFVKTILYLFPMMFPCAS